MWVFIACYQSKWIRTIQEGAEKLECPHGENAASTVDGAHTIHTVPCLVQHGPAHPEAESVTPEPAKPLWKQVALLRGTTYREDGFGIAGWFEE